MNDIETEHESLKYKILEVLTEQCSSLNGWKINYYHDFSKNPSRVEFHNDDFDVERDKICFKKSVILREGGTAIEFHDKLIALMVLKHKEQLNKIMRKFLYE